MSGSSPDPTGSLARVVSSFARVGFLRMLGATLRSVRPGEVEIELPFSPLLTQQQGFVHGGVIATILDAACGYAALSCMPEGSEVLTIEFKINFLVPAVGDRFVAYGRVVRAGRNISVCQGEVVSHGGSDGAAPTRTIAVMQASMMRVDTTGVASGHRAMNAGTGPLGP